MSQPKNFSYVASFNGGQVYHSGSQQQQQQQGYQSNPMPPLMFSSMGGMAPMRQEQIVVLQPNGGVAITNMQGFPGVSHCGGFQPVGMPTVVQRPPPNYYSTREQPVTTQSDFGYDKPPPYQEKETKMAASGRSQVPPQSVTGMPVMGFNTGPAPRVTYIQTSSSGPYGTQGYSYTSTGNTAFPSQVVYYE